MVAVARKYEPEDAYQEAEEVDDLGFDTYTRDKIEQILCSRIESSVQGSSQRDQQLGQFDLQLEGRLQPQGEQRWPNGSYLNHPLSRQMWLQTVAMISQAQRKDPKWTVDADDPANDDTASKLEKWLARKSVQYKLNDHLLDVAKCAVRDYGAILYCGWKERIRTRSVPMFHRIDEEGELEDDFEPVRAEQRDLESFAYARVDDATEPYKEKGCDHEVVEMIDFYLSPPTAQSIEKADGCGWRKLMTESQLWDGIDDFGFEEEMVRKLIDQGPTHGMDAGDNLFEIRNQFDGTSGGTVSDGQQEFYEVFLVYMRTPMHQSGEWFDIPDDLLQADLEAYLCPSRNVVIKLGKSPYHHRRPFIKFDMLSRTNRMLGLGAMQLLTEIQEEATHNLQLRIDAGNIQMSPTLIVPREHYNELSAFSVYPGALIPEEIQGSIRALQWDFNASVGAEQQAELTSMGRDMMGAEGYGILQPKVREKAETENMLGAADTKFDLFLYGMQAPMVPLALWWIELHVMFDDTMEETFRWQGQKVTVTADMLRGEYTITPTATSSTASPQSRLQITQAAQQVQGQYFTALSNPQANPMFFPYLWHGAREMLSDMGKKTPEQWIGPEPQQPQPAQQGAIPPQLQAEIAADVPPQVIQQSLMAQAGANPALAATPPLQAGGGVQ